MFLGLGLGIPVRGAGGVSQPKLDLNFAQGSYGVNGNYSGSLPTAFSYTRSGPGTAETSAQLLVLFAVDAPRITNRGLLLETTSTNLFFQSQTFQTTWTKVGGTTTTDARVAPDGTTTADTLVEDTSNGAHCLVQSQNVKEASATYCASVFYYPLLRARCQIYYSSVFNPAPAQSDFICTGSGSAVNTFGTGAVASVQSGYSGFYRLALAGLATNNTSPGGVFFALTNGSTNSYTGSGSAGADYWGAQVEKRASPSSYIPTTTAAVTRGRDELRITIPAGASRYVIDYNGGQLTGAVTPGASFDPFAVSEATLDGKYVSRLRII